MTTQQGDLVPVHGGLSEPVDRIVPVSNRRALTEEAAGLPALAVTAADLSTVYRIGEVVPRREHDPAVQFDQRGLPWKV